MRSPQENASLVDRWLRSLLRKEIGTAFLPRYDMVRVEEITPNRPAVLATVGDPDPVTDTDKFPVARGFHEPAVGLHYPMVQDLVTGEKWIKAFGDAACTDIVSKVTHAHTLGVAGLVPRADWAGDLQIRCFQYWETPGPTGFSFDDAIQILIRDGDWWYGDPCLTVPGANTRANGVDLASGPHAYSGPPLADIRDVCFGACRSELYLAAGDTLYRNGDPNVASPASNTFTAMGSPGFAIWLIAPDLALKDVVYVCSESGQVAKSRDGGKHWQARASIPAVGTVRVFACVRPDKKPKTPSQLVAGDSDFDPPGGPGTTSNRHNDTGDLTHISWHVSADDGTTWGSNDQMGDFTQIPPPSTFTDDLNVSLDATPAISGWDASAADGDIVTTGHLSAGMGDSYQGGSVFLPGCVPAGITLSRFRTNEVEIHLANVFADGWGFA